MKLFTIAFFCYFFRGDDSLLDEHLRDLEFLSYYFVLSIEFIVSGIISLNFASLFKESMFNNSYFIILINIFLAYILLLIFFNSSNYSNDVLSITIFFIMKN